MIKMLEDALIYPVCIKSGLMRYSSNIPLQPIVAGAAFLTEEERANFSNDGYIFDDEHVRGGGLSAFNVYWGELSAVHWIVQCAKSRYVGHAHYRRGWDENRIMMAEHDVLYVPAAVRLPNSMNLGQQFECINYENRQFVQKYNELVRRGLTPFSFDMARRMWSVDYIHPCLMCFGPRGHYVRIMEILFAALFPFWEEYKDEILSIKGYPARVMAFLAERLMTGILQNSDYYMGDVRIKYGGMQLMAIK